MSKIDHSKKAWLNSLEGKTKNFKEKWDCIMKESKTRRQMWASIKCTVIGGTIGLLLFRKPYVPALFGLGYGVGRNMDLPQFMKVHEDTQEQ